MDYRYELWQCSQNARKELVKDDQYSVCLPRHYGVREPGEAHKLGITEINVQEKNTCFTTERKI